MNYLGVKTTGYRHPMDPQQWTKQTWRIVAVIVLLALLFAVALTHPYHSESSDAPSAPAAAKP